MARCHLLFIPLVLLTYSSSVGAEPVTVITATTIANPEQPQAAVDDEGTIYVTFGADNAVYCCTSADDGKTYSEPRKVGELPGLALGLRRGPRIVAGHGIVVVTAISHERGDVLAWRSSDSGRTWGDPVQVNDAPNEAREGLHAMAMGPRGEIFCAWLDLRNSATQLFGALSVDNGETWSKSGQIYQSPDGSICECCHPAVTYDPQGNLYVMWRNSLGGNRDLYLATSRDGGKTFSSGRKLGTGSWQLDACPMDGGYLAATGSGNVTTVWRRGRQVFRIDSDEPRERLLGEGEQPWAATGDAGVYLVWLGRREGELWLARPGENEPKRLAGSATDPVVAAPLLGSGPVIAVWQTGQGSERSILALVVAGQ